MSPSASFDGRPSKATVSPGQAALGPAITGSGGALTVTMTVALAAVVLELGVVGHGQRHRKRPLAR